jgi:hypothetical protein
MLTTRTPLDLATDKTKAHAKLDEIFQAMENDNELEAMKHWCELAHVTFDPRIKTTWN